MTRLSVPCSVFPVSKILERKARQVTTIVLHDRNDAKAVFALHEAVEALGLRDASLRHSVSNLRECYFAKLLGRPEDGWAYDGAAYDTFWMILDEWEMVSDEALPTVTDGESETVTLPTLHARWRVRD